MIDTIKYFLVLGISISFIYYAIFVAKKDIYVRIFAILISTNGILMFLLKVIGINGVLVRNLFFISAALLAIDMTVMAWRIRKKSRKEIWCICLVWHTYFLVLSVNYNLYNDKIGLLRIDELSICYGVNRE